MKKSSTPTFMKSTPGVDFIKVGRTAQIIELALSIYALRLSQKFEKLFKGSTARTIGVGCEMVYEINPMSTLPMNAKQIGGKTRLDEFLLLKQFPPFLSSQVWYSSNIPFIIMHTWK